MAAYGIMRVEKRKRTDVAGIEIEATRTEERHQKGLELDNSDIHWDLTKDNIFLKHTEGWNRAITKQLKEAGIKPRKDAVVLLDGLYSVSWEWAEKHTKEEIIDYYKECLQFHVDTYCGGDEKLLLSAVIHFDEGKDHIQPHMQVASIPLLSDEKGLHLAAKTVMGNQGDYHKRQNAFHDKICKKRGLERGEPKKTALEKKVHKTKREWELEQLEKQQKALEKRQREDAGKKVIEAARKEINLPSILPLKVIPEKKATKFQKAEPETVVLTREDFEELRRRAATPVGIMRAVETIRNAVNDAAALERAEAAEEAARQAISQLQSAEIAYRQEKRKREAAEQRLEHVLDIAERQGINLTAEHTRHRGI